MWLGFHVCLSLFLIGRGSSVCLFFHAVYAFYAMGVLLCYYHCGFWVVWVFSWDCLFFTYATSVVFLSLGLYGFHDAQGSLTCVLGLVLCHIHRYFIYVASICQRLSCCLTSKGSATRPIFVLYEDARCLHLCLLRPEYCLQLYWMRFQ